MAGTSIGVGENQGGVRANGGTGQLIRVILADSQAIYRVGLRKVFALEDDIRVVAQAETLSNLYAALQRYPTDVVVLEGQLIAGTIDAIPELVRQHPEALSHVRYAAQLNPSNHKAKHLLEQMQKTDKGTR